MSLRSQSLRIARVLTKDLHPSSVQRSAVTWRHRPLVTNYSLSDVASNNNNYFRNFSTNPEGGSNASDAQSTEGEPAPVGDDNPTAKDSTQDAEASAAAEEGGEDGDTTAEANKIAQLESQIKDLKDSLLRSLAEQDNTRRIAQRDVANGKNFAISSFAKSLLDTSDNLSRALDAVPEELRHDHTNHPVLANLYEGISMTDVGLTKAFEKNGLTKFGEKGEKFDPNLHEALFEYPEEGAEAGSVGQVMKVGFMLKERVLRPAEVGVVKAP